MSRVSMVAILIAVAALLLASCALQPLETPEEQAPAKGAVDLALNPELRVLLDEVQPGMMAENLAEIFFATNANYVVGEWHCAEKDGHGVIRMDADGRIYRVLGPTDAVDIGFFWFSEGEFHIMSDVDQAAHESIFNAYVETTSDGTFLRLEQCGGDCPDAAGIEWLHGLTRVEPTG